MGKWRGGHGRAVSPALPGLPSPHSQSSSEVSQYRPVGREQVGSHVRRIKAGHRPWWKFDPGGVW